MKLHLSPTAGLNIITAYGDGFVQVNHRNYSRSLILTPERIIPDWAVATFADLSAGHFAALLENLPGLVLLGTGSRHHVPHPSLLVDLIDAGIGLEAMDSGAACRTYNILAAEGRKVAAALIIEAPPD